LSVITLSVANSVGKQKPMILQTENVRKKKEIYQRNTSVCISSGKSPTKKIMSVSMAYAVNILQLSVK
jgi:hypothetical protein